MPNWNDGTRWDSGARWDSPAPQPNKTKMATITTNTSNLNVLQKCEKGQSIITKSTANPLVPGNTAALASFSTKQTALVAGNAAVVTARETLTQLITQRNAGEDAWDSEVALLASFTESATGGVATSILSAGFGVRGPGTPPQPLPAPEGVVAGTNGSPGNTKVRWSALAGAVSYLVQVSPDPITAQSWKTVATPTRSSCETNGIDPGKVYWYRVAGVNPVGQGPWSAPACREVM